LLTFSQEPIETLHKHRQLVDAIPCFYKFTPKLGCFLEELGNSRTDKRIQHSAHTPAYRSS